MANKRPYQRRGGFRGRHHNNAGSGDNSSFAMQAPAVRGIYDYTLDKANLHGTSHTMDEDFEKEILERAANLTPHEDVRNKICEYAEKVIAALETEKREKSLADVGLEQIKHVGSFVTGTCTHYSDKSDIFVQLNSLPSFETVADLGNKVVENMKKDDPKETSVALPQEYGCSIMSHTCQVRILVTINPADAEKLEPGLHLDSKQMMINYFALRHSNWFAQLADNSSDEFMNEYRALIRVLKDARWRFNDFQNLSIWALQYIAYYCLVNGPNRQKVLLGTAFRRFFEVIAAGLLLPKAPSLIDPTTPMHKIGFDLTFSQMDAVCISAQTIVRIFATGSQGYRAVLGTHGSAGDLTQSTTTWKGVEIRPSIDAYKEGCMDPGYAKEAHPEALETA